MSETLSRYCICVYLISVMIFDIVPANTFFALHFLLIVLCFIFYYKILLSISFIGIWNEVGIQT